MSEKDRIVSPKRWVQIPTPGPVNVTLFESRVFADVMTLSKILRWDHLGLTRWALNPVECVPIKEARVAYRREEITEGESQGKTETEIQVMLIQAKEQLSLPETGRGKEGVSPRAFEGALPTSWLWTSGHQDHERINLCCFKSVSLWYLVQQL